MPLNVRAVFGNFYTVSGIEFLSDAWLMVTGATAGNVLHGNQVNDNGAGTVSNAATGGYATASSSGTVLLPIEAGGNTISATADQTQNNGFRVVDATSGEVVTKSGPWFFSNNNARGTWTVTQDSGSNILVSCTSLGAVSACPIFRPLTNVSNAAAKIGLPPETWEVSLISNTGSVLQTQNVRPPLSGELPVATFPSTTISANGEYFVRIFRQLPGNADLLTTIASVLTAPAVTSGGGGNTNMFSWLNNNYWYLTDLQVNLGTRAVTHRHGTVEIRPNDTVNFAVLFHDGSAGKDPVATDLKLAVRSASNTSAYYFWANPAVTTTSAGGNIYYTITVTASDEDLLAAQAAGLLAGSNTSQTLLAEVQWTTTRGTFTSDTFSITVANEVVREPDV